MSQQPLIVDPATGEVLDSSGLEQLRAENRELRAQIERLEEQLQLTERELRQKRARISRLEGKRARDWRNTSLAPLIQQVFDAWRGLCNHPRAALDGKRAELIAARLDDFDVEQLTEAISGYAAYPYVVDGRRSPTGKPDQRYDSLELILRSAAHVERGLDLAERARSEQPQRRPRGPVAITASPLHRARITCEALFGVDHVVGPNAWELAIERTPPGELPDEARAASKTVREWRRAVEERARRLAEQYLPHNTDVAVRAGWFETPCVACMHDQRTVAGTAIVWEACRRGRLHALCPAGCSDSRVLGAMRSEARWLTDRWTVDVQQIAHLLVVLRDTGVEQLWHAATDSMRGVEAH